MLLATRRNVRRYMHVHNTEADIVIYHYRRWTLIQSCVCRGSWRVIAAQHYHTTSEGSVFLQDARIFWAQSSGRRGRSPDVGGGGAGGVAQEGRAVQDGAGGGSEEEAGRCGAEEDEQEGTVQAGSVLAKKSIWGMGEKTQCVMLHRDNERAVHLRRGGGGGGGGC